MESRSAWQPQRDWKYRKCWRKIKHKYEESAAQHMREVYARTGDKLVVYYCDLCGNYHVGHERDQP